MIGTAILIVWLYACGSISTLGALVAHDDRTYEYATLVLVAVLWPLAVTAAALVAVERTMRRQA